MARRRFRFGLSKSSKSNDDTYQGTLLSRTTSLTECLMTFGPTLIGCPLLSWTLQLLNYNKLPPISERRP